MSINSRWSLEASRERQGLRVPIRQKRLPGPAFQTNELCNLQPAFEADLRLRSSNAQKNVES